jgi:hypothetical protein
MMDVPKMIFSFWQKIALPKVLGEKVHYHGEKYTCPAKDLVFFDECVDENFPEPECRTLDGLFNFKK